jgi:hypothetical protein
LTKSEPKSISLSCSSSRFTGKPENILDYNDSWWWISEDKPSSWFCITIHSKKILLSRYFFRSFRKIEAKHPQSWQLFGSNDNENWTLLNEKINQTG